MSFLGRVTKMMNNLSETVVGMAEVVGKGVGKVLKHTPTVVEAGAGAADTVINAGIDAAENIANGKAKSKFSEFLGKTSRTILSDNDSYKKVGKTNIAISKKPLIADELQRRGKQILNNGAAILDLATSDTVNIGGKEIPNMLKVIKKTDDNLLGYKLNKRGVLLGTSLAFIAGTPAAGKKFIEDRQGYNPDGRVRKLAPEIPNYSGGGGLPSGWYNEGGATGDLVLALNDLRKGGIV